MQINTSLSRTNNVFLIVWCRSIAVLETTCPCNKNVLLILIILKFAPGALRIVLSLSSTVNHNVTKQIYHKFESTYPVTNKG